MNRASDRSRDPADNGSSLSAAEAWRLLRDGEARPSPGQEASAAAAHLLDLYGPLARPGEAGWVLGHLGQSLDGFIAAANGHSHYVTGPENIEHLHRLRALADAVVVGASTVRADDPQLTVRRVEGAHPVRVVLDPCRRLGPGHRVFIDRQAPTLVLCRADRAGAGDTRHGEAELMPVPATDAGGLCPLAIAAHLRGRGLRRLFVEGGGQTVTRFLTAGALSRLQIAVAPLLIGGGRPGIALPPIDHLSRALRLRARIFRLGEDVLFDCPLPPADGA